MKVSMNRINLSDGELAELAARIQKNYAYDYRNGLLVNRRTGRAVKGQTHNKQNYRCIDLWIGGIHRHLNYHWAVWAWHNGHFPNKTIDHMNGIVTDNRIENLREVTPSENKLNTLLDWNPNDVTGVPGVCKGGAGYQTRIHGKKYHFHDPNEAFFYATMCGKRYREK